ncbi:hypothetical protein Holit_00684 [Hollandina sp. SP2]
MAPFSEEIRNRITYDNRRENAIHEQVVRRELYFCKPYTVGNRGV